MTNPPETKDEDHDASVAKVTELIGDSRVCMFTTIDANGRLVSRPMAVMEVEFDGDLWFVTDRDARKVDEVGHGARVNVAFASKGSWISVAGEAEIVRDVEKAKALWGPGIDAWFPDGPESEKIVLVKVRAETAEYSDTPGAIVASMLSFVKSRVTGEPYEVKNETVRL